ncbi:hypothetical protein L3Q82_014651 [Scortum barcoo]|uniref:Uncharacterized protein n=1 Tax=Scortum barcoo TaxID=214431 RepID=A0ACB8VY06_9TELE|nr:hypothetical protein L3Q82_014651 [Scortum barcoo]
MSLNGFHCRHCAVQDVFTLNTGAPQGCVLSPLLFTLLTHDCTPPHSSNLLIKFVDDMTVAGLSNNDETDYRREVSRLALRCDHNSLSLNVEKTKEIVVDFRRTPPACTSDHQWCYGICYEDLSWTLNTTSLAKKANQHLYFLCKLRKARAPAPIMCTFYRGTIGACSASCRKTLQRIVRAAEKIVGASLPSLQDIYTSRLTRKALCIARDPTHPSHSFFSLLPSGRKLWSLWARTSRLRDSFVHQAVRMLNSLPALPLEPDKTDQLLKLQACLKDIKAWMTRNFLLLNSDKTEVILLGPKHLRNTFSPKIALLDGINWASSTTVRNLWGFI